ncbi:hypothetical protein EXIGLDRAFT_783275 [Exidia glandulosa HHB12029]|uniref:Uncharacterized protein n=1 Tax=Exidia glandulosa HHB12029 TaxID=1314781 RepID=A0A166N5H3_EXIGL|nr:hypothetical protein EXIGLDRAFT_783275 [Exidia glandulosa HHB12029]
MNGNASDLYQARLGVHASPRRAHARWHSPRTVAYIGAHDRAFASPCLLATPARVPSLTECRVIVHEGRSDASLTPSPPPLARSAVIASDAHASMSYLSINSISQDREGRCSRPVVVIAREDTGTSSGAFGKQFNLKLMGLAADDLIQEFFSSFKDTGALSDLPSYTWTLSSNSARDHDRDKVLTVLDSAITSALYFASRSVGATESTTFLKVTYLATDAGTVQLPSWIQSQPSESVLFSLQVRATVSASPWPSFHQPPPPPSPHYLTACKCAVNVCADSGTGPGKLPHGSTV